MEVCDDVLLPVLNDVVKRFGQVPELGKGTDCLNEAVDTIESHHDDVDGLNDGLTLSWGLGWFGWRGTRILLGHAYSFFLDVFYFNYA